jgi:hypothetical protein
MAAESRTPHWRYFWESLFLYHGNNTHNRAILDAWRDELRQNPATLDGKYARYVVTLLDRSSTQAQARRHPYDYILPQICKPKPDDWKLSPKWIPGVEKKKQKTFWFLKPYNKQKDGFDPNYIGVDPFFVGNDNFRISRADFGPGFLSEIIYGKYQWVRIGSRVQLYRLGSRWAPKGYEPFDYSSQELKRLGKNEIPELGFPRGVREVTWDLPVQPQIIQSPSFASQNLESFINPYTYRRCEGGKSKLTDVLRFEKFRFKPKRGHYIQTRGEKGPRWHALKHETIICPAGFKIKQGKLWGCSPYRAQARDPRAELKKELDTIRRLRWHGAYLLSCPVRTWNDTTFRETKVLLFEQDELLPYAIQLVQSNPFKRIEDIHKLGPELGKNDVHESRSPLFIIRLRDFTVIEPIPPKLYLARLQDQKKRYAPAGYSPLVCTHPSHLPAVVACKCPTVDQRVLFERLLGIKKLLPGKKKFSPEEPSDESEGEELELELVEEELPIWPTERDPGDYGIANELADSEYGSDTWEYEIHPYDSDNHDPSFYEPIINKHPAEQKDRVKHASTGGRSARDWSDPRHKKTGNCEECGGEVYLRMRDEEVCIRCGLVADPDGREALYREFDEVVFGKTKQERIDAYREYYENHPCANNCKIKLPRLRSLESYKNPEHTRLRDLIRGLEEEQIKILQVRRVISEMWPRDQLPRDPFKAIKDSTVVQGRFCDVWESVYGYALAEIGWKARKVALAKIKFALNFENRKKKRAQKINIQRRAAS